MLHSDITMQQPDYDAKLYSDVAEHTFPLLTRVLNVYNMTFEVPPEQPSGVDGKRTPGPFQFLDVGCACGTATKKILLPNSPDSVDRIVGVDICSNMVSFAREHNAHPKLAYEQLDITGDVSQLLEKYGPFDRLYVFNSLNRVKDQAAAWRNMQKLLKPGGECLLFYCAWYMTPDIWRALAKKDRWSRFAELWESLIPVTQDMQGTEERLNYVRSLAKETGLQLRSGEIAHIYLPIQDYTALMIPVTPGIQTLTHAERQMLQKDIEEEVQKWQASRKNSPLTDNYIIHAVKPRVNN
ncbi:juvenile hormone acid O-methyltransferase-like [Rhipicephalus microplus]|uniref:juvenile hormone acid O-methyltransferase-like n=1 Tax=Rhipicephalus microplus TaxID=6941 RepID=UPI003F6C6754